MAGLSYRTIKLTAMISNTDAFTEPPPTSQRPAGTAVSDCSALTG
jgi:hypothetical protein